MSAQDARVKFEADGSNLYYVTNELMTTYNSIHSRTPICGFAWFSMAVFSSTAGTHGPRGAERFPKAGGWSRLALHVIYAISGRTGFSATSLG